MYFTSGCGLKRRQPRVPPNVLTRRSAAEEHEVARCSPRAARSARPVAPDGLADHANLVGTAELRRIFPDGLVNTTPDRVQHLLTSGPRESTNPD
jgi:hypothetical protein